MEHAGPCPSEASIQNVSISYASLVWHSDMELLLGVDPVVDLSKNRYENFVENVLAESFPGLKRFCGARWLMFAAAYLIKARIYIR